MIFPQNGSIVVVDDKKSEAQPLIDALSKHGLHTHYFDATHENLPKTPLPRVRMLFLDLVLGDYLATEKNIITTLMPVLKRIVNSEQNGPFLLVTWTGHPQLAKTVSQHIRDEGYAHILIVLKKRECMSHNRKLSLTKIQNKLKEKLQGQESFELFLLWENLVGKASSNIFSSFFQLANQDEKWDEQMRVSFLKLATGILGQRIQPGKPLEVMENIFYALNGAFLDELRLETKVTPHTEKIPISFVGLANKLQDPKIDGKINSKLLLTKKYVNAALPGNVYQNNIVLKISVDYIVDKNKIKSSEDLKSIKNNVIHVVLEVTPVCDYVQKKSLRTRLLPGILLPIKYEDKIKKHTDYLYKSPLIEYESELFILIFDHRAFTSICSSKLKGKRPLFTLQNELLSDIQSRLANHVSRLGVTYVEKLTAKKRKKK